MTTTADNATAAASADTNRGDLVRFVAAALGDGNLYPQWSEILAPTIVDRLNPVAVRRYRVTNDVRRETFKKLPEAIAWAHILDTMHRDVEHQVETMMEVSFDTPWVTVSEQ